jgi:hypothetical protein
VTVVGLVVGAVGIAILWAAGVEFPIYPPPGILGLFVTVGFLVSGGLPNLVGRDGTSQAIGTRIQMIGVLTALVAGVMATRAKVRQ